jgi:hypothetical protein
VTRARDRLSTGCLRAISLSLKGLAAASRTLVHFFQIDRRVHVAVVNRRTDSGKSSSSCQHAEHVLLLVTKEIGVFLDTDHLALSKLFEPPFCLAPLRTFLWVLRENTPCPRTDMLSHSRLLTVAKMESEQVRHNARNASRSMLYLPGMNAGVSRAV